MSGELFGRGMALGFSIAAPVGPIGLLCIRRSAAEGRDAGLATGLGAAAADSCYGAVAAFGLTAVSGALGAHHAALSLGGGAFLLWLGLRTARAAPARSRPSAPGARGLAAAFASTFVLTLANPATIVSFVAAFSVLGPGAGMGPAAAVSLVAGVFAGSACWWLLLSSAVGALRGRLDERALRWINRLSGGLLAALGAAALFSAARELAMMRP
jgi:threonine/homoserine/homoserine lactone efflux protein